MKKQPYYLLFIMSFFFLVAPVKIEAMHISEGFLPIGWCIFWAVLCLPFLYWGVKKVNYIIAKNPQQKLLIGVGGAFVFVLSALKLPSVSGSSSHATGIGLGSILFGPGVMTVIGSIVLLMQGLLLAHGGLTTLGANIFSMAVMGSLTAYGVFRLGRKINLSNGVVVFLSAFLSDMITYIVTSFQIAIAHPSEIGGFMASFVKLLTVFAITQVPLAISEGILTVIVFNMLMVYSKNELKELSVLSQEVL